MKKSRTQQSMHWFSLQAQRCAAFVIKVFSLICLLTLPNMALAATDTSIAPAAEGYLKGHHYAMYDLGLTWNEAKAYCEKLGGHLASITSSSEQSVIDSILKSGGKNCYWIGGYENAGWNWITGETLSYKHWAYGQPDNFHSVETCLHVYRNSNPLSSSGLGEWNDLAEDGTCNGEAFFGVENFGFICEWDSIESDQYMILVVDENGDPVEGAEVSFDGNTATTGSEGAAYFDALTTWTNPVITVSKDKYLPWTNKDTNWTKSASRFETVILYPESASKMKLSRALYSNLKNMSFATDLLTNTKIVSLGNEAFLTGDLDFGNFYVSCTALEEQKNISTYQIWQGKKKIADSTDGKFALNSESFAEGGNCFIRVIGKDNSKIDTHINLTFTKEEINKVNSISLTGKALSFAIGDDVPFLGGGELSLDLPISVPVTYVVDENKTSVGFNLNLAGGKSGKEQIKAAKEMISDMQRLKGLNVQRHDNMMSGGQVSKYNSLIKDTNQWKFFKGGSVSLLGYVEGDHGATYLKGAIMLVGKIDVASYDFNTWCVVVPVTVQFKFGVEGTLTGEVKFDITNSTLSGGVRFTPAATLTAFGGVGVSKLAGLGVYGSAKLQGDFQILPQPAVNSVDLTGELGIKAYLAWLTYQKPFAYNTWHLYTGNNVRSGGQDLWGGDEEIISKDGSVMTNEELLYRQLISGMFDASQYKKDDLSYLASETDNMGRTTEPDKKARTTDLRSEFEELITNTYRNAQPVMVEADGALYAAFLRANADSGNIYTVISRYDGSDWDTAVAAASGDLLDGSPSLLYDGTNLWLAFARTNAGYDRDSLLSYAKNQQIVVGRVDTSTLAFTESNVYSCSGYGHMQSLALAGGKPTLVYVDSTVTDDNSVLWPETNTVYTATCSGTTWSSASPVKTIDKVLSDLTVGEQDGTLAIGCVLDEDGKYDTNSDRNVYVLTGDTLSQLANGANAVTYGILPGTDSAAFLWIEGETIHTSDGKNVTIAGLSGNYKVIGDSIYFSATTDEGAELAVIRWVDGAWTEPMTLTEGSGYFENLNVATLNGEDYALGLYTNVNIDDESIDDVKSLVWTQVQDVSDVRIDDVEYDLNGIKCGDTVPVSLTVANAGDHAVTQLMLVVDDVETTKTVTLPVGGSCSVALDLTCPEDLQSIDITVTEYGKTDYHPDDNTVSVKLGYPDMSVQMTHQQIGSKSTIYAIVTNEGVGMASGKVTITDQSDNVLAEEYFSNVQAGNVAACSVVFDWNNYDVNRLDVTAALTLSTEDLYEYNNIDVLHLMHSGHHIIETDFILPASLKEIESYAFTDCAFTAVCIPDGVTTIGDKAFAGCASLKQIEIPASVTSISANAFDDTSGFVIYCPAGSYAETYATKYKITCVTE